MSSSYYIGNVEISRDALKRIDTLMELNQKVEAIKYVREISGLGLADAKHWVENYQSYDLNERQSFGSPSPPQISDNTVNTRPDNIEDKGHYPPKEKPSNKTKRTTTFEILFPTTYGNTRFSSMEDVKEQIETNPDALGFFSQCSLYGAGTEKKGESAIDGLFESANAGCSDAILILGRLYEYGMSFMRRDVSQALTLYKYAYSLQNIDALHSLGYLLYSTYDKREIGVAMMKKSAELGSRGAKFHLELISDEIRNLKGLDFEDIPSEVFQFSKPEAMRGISLYTVDLTSQTAIKNALLATMNNMKPQTFSVIMNEFRMKHLRGRDLNHFKGVDFRGAFDSLVEDGVIETGGVSDFGVTEDTLYISRESTQKMKTTVLTGDAWDF